MFQYTFSSNTKNPVNSRVGRAFDQRLSSERRLSRPARSHFSSARRPVLLGYWIGKYHSLSRPEIQATFRGEKRVVKAGETINIPANAPHQFHNSSSAPARMLCICSPAGQEELFKEAGIPFTSRTMPPPELSDEQQAAFVKKVLELAPKYRTELLKEA